MSVARHIAIHCFRAIRVFRSDMNCRIQGKIRPMNTTDPYRKFAPGFDRFAEPYLRSLRKAGLAFYPPRAGMKVLDIGCGTGTLLQHYQRAGCEIFGIDVSPSMFAVAQQKLGSSATLHFGSAAAMPWPDATFELIVSSMMFHEVSDDLRAAILADAKRVLKPDGVMVITDFHSGPISFPGGWFHCGMNL
jgi:ubiquinone/menaquinone biosynthesis C-methylase UbiE